MSIEFFHGRGVLEAFEFVFVCKEFAVQLELGRKAVLLSKVAMTVSEPLTRSTLGMTLLSSTHWMGPDAPGNGTKGMSPLSNVTVVASGDTLSVMRSEGRTSYVDVGAV